MPVNTAASTVCRTRSQGVHRRGQADRQGQAFGRPIGIVLAGALKGDIRESLNRFKSVLAPA
jgi:hypothetical protein